MNDIYLLFLFVFVLMGCASYIGTMVLTVGTRRDMQALLDQRLALYDKPIVPDERRIERLEAGMLILHEGQKAIVARLDLIDHKLDHYTPTTAAFVPVSLSHETRQRSLDRESKQLQAAVAWLIANDRGLKLTTREAERLSGISRATINRAQQWVKNS